MAQELPTVAEFKAFFPALAGTADATITSMIARAGADIEPCVWPDAKYTYCAALYAAHLVSLDAAIAGGNAPGIVTAATVDKVTVTLAAPVAPNALHYWLNLSTYGQEYLARLRGRGAGGLYVGGSPERRAFRSVGGRFGSR